MDLNPTVPKEDTCPEWTFLIPACDAHHFIQQPIRQSNTTVQPYSCLCIAISCSTLSAYLVDCLLRVLSTALLCVSVTTFGNRVWSKISHQYSPERENTPFLPTRTSGSGIFRTRSLITRIGCFTAVRLSTTRKRKYMGKN